jgi:hypothetical protein
MPERDAAHCQNNRHQLMYHTDELTPVHAEFYGFLLLQDYHRYHAGILFWTHYVLCS